VNRFTADPADDVIDFNRTHFLAKEARSRHGVRLG
jgi:hypothetical protein